MEYDLIYCVKENILLLGAEAYIALERACDCTGYEREIIDSAILKVLEEVEYSHDNYTELLKVSYMLRGIVENLRSEFGAYRDEEKNPTPF